MSAPPLSEAEPISVGASFYVSEKPKWRHLLTKKNSINATFYPYEARPEPAEGMAPPQNK